MSGQPRGAWIFGYGSLMWRPGFPYLEAQRATLVGFRRCFCVHSVHHRGTRTRPGLVLGLDRGGACTGMAFRISADDAPRIRAYLRAREQTEGVYREAHLPVELLGTREEVLALAFIVERSHVNYAGRLAVAMQARIIASARGVSGANADYLINTLEHLDEMGIRERELERVLTLVGPYTARERGAGNGYARPTSLSMQRALSAKPALTRPRQPKNPGQRFLYRLQGSSV